MAVVTFTLNRGLANEQREQALDHVRGIEGITHVGVVNPNTKTPELQRFAFADVSEAIDLSDLVEKITAIPEIESAEVPPRRKLV